MSTYISYSELSEVYNVSKNTINCGIKRNRLNKTDKWSHVKNGVVKIDIDSIPTTTRIKYNIPTSKELEAIELKKLEAKKEILENNDKLFILEHFNKALDFEYLKYLHHYKENYKTTSRQIEKSKQHAIYQAIIDLVGVNRAKRGRLKTVWNVYQTLNFKGQIKTKDCFSKNFNLAKKDLSQLILHKNLGNDNRVVFSNFHKAMAFSYAIQKNIY